jgi:hypothetical protein
MCPGTRSHCLCVIIHLFDSLATCAHLFPFFPSSSILIIVCTLLRASSFSSSFCSILASSHIIVLALLNNTRTPGGGMGEVGWGGGGRGWRRTDREAEGQYAAKMVETILSACRGHVDAYYGSLPLSPFFSNIRLSRDSTCRIPMSKRELSHVCEIHLSRATSVGFQ